MSTYNLVKIHLFKFHQITQRFLKIRTSIWENFLEFGDQAIFYVVFGLNRTKKIEIDMVFGRNLYGKMSLKTYDKGKLIAPFFHLGFIP